MKKTEAEWRELLSPEQFHVMREKGTEPPFTGKLNKMYDDGIYRCAACNAELFTSDKKFDSGSGWPSFWLPVSADAITAIEDTSHGMRRVEVTCANCGAHLAIFFRMDQRQRECAIASTRLRWILKRNNSLNTCHSAA